MKLKNIYFIATLCIVMILSACSTKSTDEKTIKEGEGKIEIEFWYGLGSEAHKKMQTLIDAYNKSQDQYVVKGISQASYTETFQKLQSSIASNEAPALVIAEADMVNTLAQKQALTDLTSFTKDDEQFKEEDFLPVFMEKTRINDGLYAIPAYGTTQVIYYRKDIYEKAGLDPKEAFSSWENIAKSSKQLQEQGDVAFGHLPMWGPHNLIDIALSNGGKILNDEGTEVLIDSKEWIEAWDFIRQQIHEEKTMKVNSGGQGWEYWYRTIDEVMNGSAASYTGSSGDKGNLDFSKIASTTQPGLNGKDAKPVISTLYMATPSIVSDEEKAAAYDFMMYFSGAKANADWAQNIGYIPVRQSAMEVPEYKAFLEKNPDYAVPFEQAQFGIADFIDPTNGKIIDALSIATDKVELQNIDAKTALTEAKKEAQKALEKVKK